MMMYLGRGSGTGDEQKEQQISRAGKDHITSIRCRGAVGEAHVDDDVPGGVHVYTGDEQEEQQVTEAGKGHNRQ